MKPPAVCVRCQSQCGESPIWDPAARLLSWIDTENPLFSSLDPATGTVATAKTPWLVQAIGRRKGGGWIAVVRDGFALLDVDPSKATFLGNPVEGNVHLSMNDGAVGPDGRFYAGSLNVDVLDAPDGCLHRVDPDGRISTIETGLVLPNGISFSPDGRTLYVTEMWVNTITAFDFDASAGTVSRRRALIRVPDEEGHPDGLIVDSDGFLWSGHWQGFRVTRYDPDGRKVSTVDVPVPTATCMAFGGPELDQLYITTGKKGLSPEQLQKYPGAGDLFMVKTGIHGRIEPAFGG
jgi:sugar lactone lactonase YvrE